MRQNFPSRLASWVPEWSESSLGDSCGVPSGECSGASASVTSPWYNPNGWLGVKHQLTSLPASPRQAVGVAAWVVLLFSGVYGWVFFGGSVGWGGGALYINMYIITDTRRWFAECRPALSQLERLLEEWKQMPSALRFGRPCVASTPFAWVTLEAEIVLVRRICTFCCFILRSMDLWRAKDL